MQQTRRHILEILKEQREATIDEIVKELTSRIGKITAVTVRHHLEILRGDGLVATPAVRRRSAPGRPQYVYNLTERAADHFPNNYQGLANGLISEIKNRLDAAEVNDILAGVATHMAADAMIPDGPIEVRLDHIVEYLNQNGYGASWSQRNGVHELKVANCPYDHVTCQNPEICKMDETLLAQLIGSRPERLSSQAEQDEACIYRFAQK